MRCKCSMQRHAVRDPAICLAGRQRRMPRQLCPAFRCVWINGTCRKASHVWSHYSLARDLRNCTCCRCTDNRSALLNVSLGQCELCTALPHQATSLQVFWQAVKEASGDEQRGRKWNGSLSLCLSIPGYWNECAGSTLARLLQPVR